jgi:hypothetical protein
MVKGRTIEVLLPEGVPADTLDLELLKATFHAIVALRSERGREWEKTLRQLEHDGWGVSWGMCWHAEAKRDADYERANGRTLDEAFAELAQLARLDEVGHLP